MYLCTHTVVVGMLSFLSLSLVVNAPPSPAKLAMKQKMENMRREHTVALKHEGMRMKNEYQDVHICDFIIIF